MKAVLFYEASDTPMDKIIEAYPRHKAVVDAFHARGDLLAVGTFADPVKDGSMAVFRDRAAAETFVAEDPFAVEKLVRSAVIKDWNETLMG